MIEGTTVNLRLFAEDDLEPCLTAFSRLADRGEYLPLTLRSHVEARKQFGENGWWGPDEGRMAITNKDGDVLGDIGFFRPSRHQVGYELGYGIHESKNRGHGTMTEALRIFSAYLFETMEIPRIQIVAARGNTASRRVAEKCGYRHEGTLRSFVFARGQYHDADILSLLREECPSLAEALKA